MSIINTLSEFFYHWQDLIGAFIGSALAGLIAYLSIRKTHNNQKELDKENYQRIFDLENEKIKVQRYQEEKVYCGYLYAVWGMMIGQKNFLIGQRRELEAILEDFKVNGRIAYDKAFNIMPVDLLKECYLRIIGYEKYDSRVIDKLTAYLSVMESMNNELNFIPLKKIKEEIHNNEEYRRRVEFYFTQLYGHIDHLSETAQKLEKETLEIIKKSDTSSIFVGGASEIKDKLKELDTTSHTSISS